MDSLWQDLRYALRMLVKTPGMTAVLVITLALGIGASTTIFSVVHSVVIRPLPYKDPGQLVRVYTEFLGRMQLKRFWVSGPEFDDLRRSCSTCAAVGGWSRGSASLSGGDRPVRVEAAYATHDLLPLLGVPPLLGRFYDAREDSPGGDPTVVVLGYDVWQRAFAGDPSIIGRKIHLDAMPVSVIGVMPKGFDFLDREEAWVPAKFDMTKLNRGGHFINVVARVKDGLTIDHFRSELLALSNTWINAERHSIRVDRHPMIALPFQEDLVGSMATTLWLLQAAVLFVLLISIVNVANLLLARSEGRTREVAVRHALGASRRRLVRQFLTESVVLGVVGGGLGILVAVWAVDGVTALIPSAAPRANEIALDGQAVAFAAALALFASLLFGLAPIVHARKTDLHGALKDGSPRMTGSKARLRVRRALVIGEVALAVVLVIGCTVMVRSFLRLQRVDLGFNPDRVLTFGVEIPVKTYPGTTGDTFWRRLEDRLRALPGVASVGLIDGQLPARPLNANDIGFTDLARTPDGPQWNVDYWQVIGDDGFEALGAKIVKGRGIRRTDDGAAPAVVVINEAFANRFWPGQDPIGKHVILTEFSDGRHPEQTVVGVVADMKNAGIDQPAGTEVFIPLAQYALLGEPPQSRLIAYVVVRTEGDPKDLIPAVHRVMGELDPSLPLFGVSTMDDLMWEAIARPRFLTFLLTSFAALALLLAAVGIYGVMAHTVAQRTHEIGLRVALGARPAQVRAMVLRQAAILVAAGVGIGIGVAVLLDVLLGGSLHGLLYGGELSQPLLLGGVSVAVTIAALVATWIPVRRATRVEPTVALRSE